ncbi:MAG: spermidine/putrescine ABC transporter [Candidatus Rokuibacteriota bacterium]|nr:MAG: spermidine/putrescine ABC transporter [Candidatus Rokubacteria bacterium]
MAERSVDRKGGRRVVDRENEGTVTRDHASNISRRRLLSILGMGGSALGLATVPLARRGFAQPSKATVRYWASGTMTIEKFWAQLERDEGIKVVFSDNGNDPGPVVSRMVFGNANDLYDVGGLQGGAEKELALRNAIAPWDLSKIPNWNDVWSWAKEIPYTQVNGKQYGIPAVVNADSMIYLPQKVGKVDSYHTVFDPKLKGKTAMEDAWINSAIFTAIYLKENNLLKIKDPGNLEKDELQGVMEFLIKKKKDGQFRTFWNGWEQGVQLVTSQEVWVMTGWEPIVYAARRAGVQADYAVPKEGYEGWSNDLLLHRGAVDRKLSEAAHRMANWILGGYYGAALSKLRGYVVPTDHSAMAAAKSGGEFDAKVQADLNQHVKNKFFSKKGATHWQNVRPTHFQLYEEWWQKLRNA